MARGDENVENQRREREAEATGKILKAERAACRRLSWLQLFKNNTKAWVVVMSEDQQKVKCWDIDILLISGHPTAAAPGGSFHKRSQKECGAS